MNAAALTRITGGARLAVRAKPGSSRDGVGPMVKDAAGRAELEVRVRAAPEGGKANRAVEATLANALGFPKSALCVASGMTSRHKLVEISADHDAVRAALKRLAAR